MEELRDPNGSPGCPNCGAGVVGPFCPACGQDQGPLQPALRQWLKGVVDELFLVDARIPRSLGMLVRRPGALTSEWAEGRRARHVAPVRLFLASAIVFFFAWELAQERQGTFFADLISGALEGWYEGEGSAKPADLEERAREMADRVVSALQVLLLFGSVPLLAVLCSGLRHAAGRAVLHLTFSLHLHAVGLAILSAWLLVGYLVPGLAEGNALLIPLGLMTLYLVVSLRTTFSMSNRAAILGGIGVALTYTFLASMLAVGYGLLPLARGGP